jgi:hypothetical protein
MTMFKSLYDSITKVRRGVFSFSILTPTRFDFQLYSEFKKQIVRFMGGLLKY